MPKTDSMIGFLVTVVATLAVSTVVGVNLHEQSVSTVERQAQGLANEVGMQQERITDLEADIKARDLLIQGMLMNK